MIDLVSDKGNKRFQDCSFFEKLGRRLKYQIPCAIKAFWVLLMAPFGLKKVGASLTYYDWQVKANWVYDIDPKTFFVD